MLLRAARSGSPGRDDDYGSPLKACR